ncbi:MAG TPA: M20/M25/M40 family metallo-hydrolase [Dehalococcoidia bacterium]|jgi:acetylornithine deacetylase|nr:M20/M25/M40 family metallo-hydrolase [Chloroflexota bacterium]HIB11603.1 M20/M25/M40 family metallo-hydrolase [Dehalococcoidia bacterium]|tara:strand:- start:23412 stop:24659 length:1248 start_codon:yes stop_codon:yes gene_type:complete
MDPNQAKVIEQVDEKAIVDLAGELIKIPSFKLEETPVATFLADFFGSRGYKVDLQDVEPGRFQTIATLEGTGGGPSLMLNGHTDINSLTRRWRRDPWVPVVEGDRLYGHGVQNMKGGLASIIMAAEAVRQSGVRLKGDLVVACVVGETQGGEGTHFLMESGFRTDMAVVAEPFGVGNLITVHSGIVHMAIHTYGVTGHIRQPQGTVNAVEKMTRVIDALGRVEFTYQPRADMPDLPKLNVGSVIGGLGEDYILVEPPYIPDLCTIIVDVHFVPGQTVVGIVADIRRVLDPLQAGDPELSYEIEIPPPESFKGRRRLVMDPLDVPRDAEIVQAVARCHREVTGEPPKAIGAVLPFSYTANDTCHLWNAGIPCLLYGPAVVRGGDGEDDSCVIISEMVQCAKVLALTALDVCGTAES